MPDCALDPRDEGVVKSISSDQGDGQWDQSFFLRKVQTPEQENYGGKWFCEGSEGDAQCIIGEGDCLPSPPTIRRMVAVRRFGLKR